MDETFEDLLGRRWAIEVPLDIRAVHRARQMASIDLLSVRNGVRPLPTADHSRTLLTLWAVVSTDAAAGNVSRDEFFAGLADPTILDRAINAVTRALAPHAPPEFQAELARQGLEAPGTEGNSDQQPPPAAVLLAPQAGTDTPDDSAATGQAEPENCPPVTEHPTRPGDLTTQTEEHTTVQAEATALG